MNDTNKVYAMPNIVTPNSPVIYDENVCTGCNHCVEVCQVDVFIPNEVKGKPPVILHPDECWACGCCVNDCPVPGSIRYNWPVQQRAYWEDKASNQVIRDKLT